MTRSFSDIAPASERLASDSAQSLVEQELSLPGDIDSEVLRGEVASLAPESTNISSTQSVASRALEVAGLVLLPVVMAVSAAFGIDQGGAAGIIASAASVGLFFLSYEWGRPALRETMPVVVMAALAAAGRIIFAFIPSVQPMTAVVIMTGCLFGRRSGFMVGALAGLVSALFLGMGAWTAWQMYSWGLIGWLAGVLSAVGVFSRKGVVFAYGLASGLLYGLVMNIWSMLAFYHPESFAQMLVIWAPAIPYDMTHGISTVVFLVLLWAPWHRKLKRLKKMYGLGDDEGEPASRLERTQGSLSG